MLKKELRKRYLEKRKTLSADEVNFLSEKILEKFIVHFNVSENQKIHIFLPISKLNEINTLLFINYFWEKGVQVFIPKVIEGHIISINYTPETILVENSWGIKEPISSKNDTSFFNFVITPLLYCDDSGNRIGYGKGFYDDFFKKINGDAKKIGVNFFSPIEFIDDVSDQDVKLDYLITPDEILSFSETSIFTK